MIYLTGDIHGDPMQVELFCSKMQLTEDNTIIMLGDVGVNYYGGKKDRLIKRIFDNNSCFVTGTISFLSFNLSKASE